METQMTEGKGDQRRTKNRGRRAVLESDCAIVVPASSTTAFHHHHHYYHLNTAEVVRQHVDFSELDSSDKYSEQVINSVKDSATSCFRLLADQTQKTCLRLSPETVEHRTVGTNDLETQITRLQMEDELDENGDTALHEALKMQANITEIIRLAGAAAAAGRLDAVNVRYQTALHVAVIINRPDVVSLFVSLGASLRRQERLHGDTVLHLACRLGHGACLNAIFDAWTKRTNEHAAVRHDIRTILYSINYDGETCLHVAARLRDKYIFYFLVFSFDADLNVKEGKRGQSVLHEAVNRHDMDIVNAVLGSKSFDVNQTSYDGLTALDMAISRRWTDGQRVLELAGGQTAYDPHLDRKSDEHSDMDWS